MNAHKSRKLFAFLALAVVMLLTACQTAAPAATNTPVQPDQSAVATATDLPVEPTSTLSPTATVSVESDLPITGGQAPEGWQLLEVPTLGYSLAYPPEWEICQETRYSITFCEIQKEPEGMGPPPRLYVSVYPKDYTNADWEVYNFTPAEIIQGYMDLPVGESMLKEPRSPFPDYSTYTRLPDLTVAGHTALAIENSKVWEMPSGTKDRVLYIRTEATTYNLGMYYATPEQLTIFEQVLESFQLTR